MDPSVEFYGGCVSGLVQNIIGHPFDTLKVYIQNKKTISLGSTVQSSFNKYYRGFAFPTTLSMLINGATFQINAFLSNHFTLTSNRQHNYHGRCCIQQRQQQQQQQQQRQHFINGFCTGLITSPVVFAFEVGKIKRQMNLPLQWTDFATTPGYWMTACRESVAVSVYLGSYYSLREKQYTPPFSGGVAGLLSWTFTYPVDVIKNRQTSQNFTIQKAVQMGNLWRGFGVCALRGILVNSIGFCVYDWTKQSITTRL